MPLHFLPALLCVAFLCAGDAGEKGDKGDKGEDGVGLKGSPGETGAPGTVGLDLCCHQMYAGGQLMMSSALATPCHHHADPPVATDCTCAD